MNDKILLKNMIFFAHHGAYEHEREYGQRFQIDVELTMDMERASQSDELADALDYTKVYDQVKQITETEQYKLMEALGGRIAEQLLGAFPIVAVTVRIRKPACPLPGAVDYVQIQLTRKASA